MKSTQALFTALAITCLLTAAPAHAEELNRHGAGGKLLRGVVNVFTGWVEIPMRIIETKNREDAWTGFTWGLARGLGYGFIRTVSGIYETVTFPFPAPPDYTPVIQPEYVFSGNTDTSPRVAY